MIRRLTQRWSQPLVVANRRFQFQKCRQPFIYTHDEMLSVVAVFVRNEEDKPVLAVIWIGSVRYWQLRVGRVHVLNRA
jgi:hypothetical protein